MPTANVTVTALAGPSKQSTSVLHSAVTKIIFDLDHDTFELTLSDGRPINFDYNDTATVTYTISGAIATVAISS